MDFLTPFLTIAGLGGVFFAIFRLSRSLPGPVQEVHDGLQEELRGLRGFDLSLDERLTKLERSLADILEEMEDRIDRGNKAWRRVRAAQKREEESDEQGDLWEGIPAGDAGGGEEEGMSSLHNAMAGLSRTSPDWEAQKRLINRQLAGLE